MDFVTRNDGKVQGVSVIPMGDLGYGLVANQARPNFIYPEFSRFFASERSTNSVSYYRRAYFLQFPRNKALLRFAVL